MQGGERETTAFSRMSFTSFPFSPWSSATSSTTRLVLSESAACVACCPAWAPSCWFLPRRSATLLRWSCNYNCNCHQSQDRPNKITGPPPRWKAPLTFRGRHWAEETRAPCQWCEGKARAPTLVVCSGSCCSWHEATVGVCNLHVKCSWSMVPMESPFPLRYLLPCLDMTFLKAAVALPLSEVALLAKSTWRLCDACLEARAQVELTSYAGLPASY